VRGALQSQIRSSKSVVRRAVRVLGDAARAEEVLALGVAKVLDNGAGAAVCEEVIEQIARG
jgi:hypothetical protein